MIFTGNPFLDLIRSVTATSQELRMRSTRQSRNCPYSTAPSPARRPGSPERRSRRHPNPQRTEKPPPTVRQLRATRTTPPLADQVQAHEQRNRVREQRLSRLWGRKRQDERPCER